MSGLVLAPADPPLGAIGRAYEVSLGGEVLGVVYRGTRSWERRSPGHRYVNARGDSPCWRIEGTGEWNNFDTRREAVEYLLRERR